MQKLWNWLDKHFLKIGIAFFLIFIPLYPKFPLIGIEGTWVYIRLEDFLVALMTTFWFFQLLRRKASLKIPLALPIFLYWIVGGISLLFSLVFLRSQLLNFAPNVAIFHYLRRIEYMVVFFIAFSTVKNLEIVKKYLFFIALAVIGVCFYGFGQKFLGWPAFLTMNEEFAKGLPLYLPPAARISSTFGGHYDLAAWLVLIIALWGSLIFSFKKRLWQFGSFLLVLVSFFLLLLTASRISFVAYLFAVSLVLFLQRKKWLIIPVVLVSLFLMNYLTGTSGRFGKTFRVEQVVYDAKTGKPIAALEKEEEIGKVITEEEEIAGEDLPLGTGYISLPLTKSPEATEVAIIKKPIITSLKTASKASEIATISGEFLIKRTIVYDISFTTRFQGTWPRAFKAFQKNPLLGTGFSSISLATDNSYLRALGETGLVGFLTFLGVFFVFFLLAKQGLAKITSSLAKSIIIGVTAGVVGLALNAILIDVFEASKVAFTLWPLLGITVGVIRLRLPQRKSLIKETIKLTKSPVVSLIVLAIIASIFFSSSLNNYFVGDDFTWLRWAAESSLVDLPQFFVSAQGFFYRPLAKVYFFLVQPIFALRPQGYHLVDFLLHFGVVFGIYLLTLKITKRKLVAFLTAFLFLIHPVGAENVLWISSTSMLMANFFYLWGFLAYLHWSEKTRSWRFLLLIASYLAFLLGLASHETMVTFPLVILLTDWLWHRLNKRRIVVYFLFGLFLGGYFWLRNVVAQAHWLSGDYNYNPENLLFNFVGNLLGYLGELIAGFHFIPLYDSTRSFLRLHKSLSLGLVVLGFVLVSGILIAKRLLKKLKLNKLMVFSWGWFVILLLPFLGLGNIAERHAYLAQFGFFLFLSLVISWFSERLKRRNFKLGFYLTILFIIGLLTFYGWEMEKAKRSWYQAGEIVNKVLLTLSSNWAEFAPGTTLYFVNLPIRQERAWVFPVGLEDSLWFIYRDETLVVNQMTDLEETVNLIRGRYFTHAFFYEDGELKLISI